MFRPTQFVVLFAVVLCATALPADPANRAAHPVAERQEKAAGPGLLQKHPVQGTTTGARSDSDKSDLATDAQTYWSYRYNYNVPTLGYIAPGLIGRTYYTPYSYYGLPASTVILDE